MSESQQGEDMPTVDEVRYRYARDCADNIGTALTHALPEFDRWLADHDAEVRREAAAAALHSAADAFSQAAQKGIEPALNLAAARLLHARASGCHEQSAVAARTIRTGIDAANNDRHRHADQRMTTM